MAFYRMYTGDDGKSYIDELDLASNLEMKSLQAAKGLIFNEDPPGHFIDWHQAPRRQYIAQLPGQIEIGLADGTTVRYQPGDVRLAEDTTGHGLRKPQVLSDQEKGGRAVQRTGDDQN
jgi:hypothetical protein